MSKLRILIEAWKEMRFVWEKQKVDPNFEFDTIVSVQNDNKLQNNNDRLVISLGDLAPNSIVS